LRVADESEFASDIGEQVRYSKFASDAGDVDDCRVAIDGASLEHMREDRLRGVQRCKEVGCHGASVGGDGLVFDGAYFDDARVVD
jgi:hypothetical protein